MERGGGGAETVKVVWYSMVMFLCSQKVLCDTQELTNKETEMDIGNGSLQHKTYGCRCVSVALFVSHVIH